LHVGFYTDNGIASPTAETIETVSHAAKALADAGAIVEETKPNGTDAAALLWCDLLAPDGGTGLRALLDSIGTKDVHPLLQQFLDIVAARAIPTERLLEILAEWDFIRTRMLSFFNPPNSYDAIICPVAASPAIPHGQSYERLDIFTYTMTYNFSGAPAGTVPFGLSADGLPIGVQISSRPWREDIVLAIMSYLEQARKISWRVS